MNRPEAGAATTASPPLKRFDRGGDPDRAAKLHLTHRLGRKLVGPLLFLQIRDRGGILGRGVCRRPHSPRARRQTRSPARARDDRQAREHRRSTPIDTVPGEGGAPSTRKAPGRDGSEPVRTAAAPPFSGVNSIRGRPAVSGVKSLSLVRCTAKRAVRPATSGGYSMKSSVLSVQSVTSSVGDSPAAGPDGRPHADARTATSRTAVTSARRVVMRGSPSR